jgi:hypothetical protein
MNATEFALNRLKKVIQRQGTSFSFYGYNKNANHEPDTSQPVTPVFNGIFHEAASHITLIARDDGVIKSKTIPYIIASLSDTKLLKPEFQVNIGEKKYRVADIRDVGGYGIIADISLEVIV